MGNDNLSVMSMGSLIIISALFVITTASIAIQAYNTNTTLKKENMYKFNSAVILLVCALFIIPGGIGAIFYGYKLNFSQQPN